MPAAPIILLFTDLVNSSDLLRRAGDAQVQRIFQAHHRLLQRCVAGHGGQEAKWLGDGFVTVFTSPADALRCAVALQLAARRRPAGGRLAIRVGLHVSEVLQTETDYFGTPVVIARRLCGAAQAGQVVCSALLRTLLADQHAFTFRDCGALAVVGVAVPVLVHEVAYQQDQPLALLTHTPFVGRAAPLARLTARLQEARAGNGGLVLLAGEPGIGKTRTLEEFAETARMEGALVLWGRCDEGEAARPYAPFVEALAEYARRATPESLRTDLGLHAAPLARLVPAVRERLPEIPEPVALHPDEERVRLLDAVAQLLIALSARAPVVLVLDDLHWADPASVALLRHLARVAARQRLLVLGGYRDVEVTAPQPLADALGALPRETTYEHLGLAGLGTDDVDELLEAVADQKVPDIFVAAITTETSGNPFFIREVLLHLVEEGKIVRSEGQWISNLSVEEMGIPHGVRQVIQRRLARLSAAAKGLLRVAAGCFGGFRFDIAARVAGLDDAAGLDAIDEALAAQLLCSGTDADTFDFTHALVRHTLYAELSPPRQVRLHRQIAKVMEQVYGGRGGEHAGEIAQHYSRSATLPGAARGVAPAILAADQAEAAYAHDDAVTFLRIALALLPRHAARRARLLGRLGLALGWALNFDAALPALREAGDLIAATEGGDAAADYLAEAAMGLWSMGSGQSAWWPLASQGLGYIGDRRDLSWVRLMIIDIVRRESEDPEYAGILVDTPERRAVAEVAERLSFSRWEEISLAWVGFLAPKSRRDILRRFSDAPNWLLHGAGEYRRSIPLLEDLLAESQREGRIAHTVVHLNWLACCHNSLGNFTAADTAYDQGTALAGRLPVSWNQHRAFVRYQKQRFVDEGWEEFLQQEQASDQQPAIEDNWVSAGVSALAAVVFARLGRQDDALFLVGTVLTALDRAPGWAMGYTLMACEAATALWLLQRTDHVEVIEHNVREKVLVPDFRGPLVDARLSMAQLSALQSRYAEAADWFAQARAVLDEQGARPLRAIVDFDEALMYHRRGAPGDTERAQPLLDAALQQFHALGMPGWIRRAEALRAPCAAEASGTLSHHDAACDTAGGAGLAVPAAPADITYAPDVAVLHHEGDYWTLTHDGTTGRLRDTNGLHYLSHLLRHPGQEFHVLDLINDGSRVSGDERIDDQGGPLLDAQAKAEYRQRLSELRAELEEAQQFNDAGRAERLRTEIEAITEHLAAAVGLGGRDRHAASATERARSTVTQRIKTAIKKIGARHPSLAERLAPRVKTGTLCVYTPDPVHPIVWELDQ